MHYKWPRLRRTPLRSRRDGLVHACDSSQRPTRISQLADPSHPSSRRLEKTALCRRSSSDSSAVINRVEFTAARLRLATAALAAIARLPIIHRAIFAALLARRLICRKRSRADHRRENREENFGVAFHIDSIFRSNQGCASRIMRKHRQ